MSSFTVDAGVRDSHGSRLAHDLFRPASGPCNAVLLLLHGFGADRKSVRGHAERLAASCGVLVLTPDMSSLMSGGQEKAQLRNIAQAADAARWLASLPEASGLSLTLAGHSAGGSVVFEAAAELVKSGPPLPLPLRAVVLLDPVPWPRTVALAPTWPVDRVPLISLCCPPAAWNGYGEWRKVLAALPSPGSTVLRLPKAAHGDALDPRSWVRRLLGLRGAPGSAQLFAALLDAFVLQPAGGAALAELAERHAGALALEQERGMPASDAEPSTAAISTAAA